MPSMPPTTIGLDLAQNVIRPNVARLHRLKQPMPVLGHDYAG
jgi:hypothetical protein